jgi:hypothetical protein
MSKEKVYSLELMGKHKKWLFEIEAKPEWVEDWREDGLTVNLIENIIPEWWVNMGFSVKLWCFIQDIFRKDWFVVK